MHRRPRIAALVVICIFAVVALLATRFRYGFKADEESRLQCAHFSILNIASLHGLPLTGARVLDLLPFNKGGHSLLEIKNVLSELGLSSKGLQADLEEIDSIRLPAIVHLRNPDHFVVAVRTEGSQLLFFDASGSRKRMSIATVRNRWTGYLLSEFESAKSLQMPDGPAVSFSTLYKDCGSLSRNQEFVKFQFPFSNIGKAALVISDVVVSCGCTSVEFPDVPILPGENGLIDVTYGVTENSSDFQHSALVLSNDPRHASIELRVAGSGSIVPWVAPDVVSFGSLSPSENGVISLSLNYSGDGTVTVQSIKCPDSRVRTAIARSPSFGTSHSCFLVTTELTGPEHVLEPTAFESEILIQVSANDEVTALRIPVTANFVPVCRAFPTEVVVGPDGATFAVANSQHRRIFIEDSNASDIGMDLMTIGDVSKEILKVRLLPLRSIGESQRLWLDLVDEDGNRHRAYADLITNLRTDPG